jgi:hypothetical protein
MQQNQQINYFTFREIKSGEELITYLPGKKKKPRNRVHQNLAYKLAAPNKASATATTSQTLAITPKEIQPTTSSLVETKLKINLTTQTKLLNTGLSTFNLSLTAKNKVSKDFSLIKCDLCSLVVVGQDQDPLSNLANIKTHIYQTHLSEQEDSNAILNSSIDTLIQAIETRPVTFNFKFFL